MRDRHFSLHYLLGAVLGGLLIAKASLAPAQSLYRVELMVFAYPAGGAAEQWEPLPELSYPEGARLLVDPSETPGTSSTTPAAGQSPVAADPGIAPLSTVETYVPLPASTREFGAKAASMRSSGRYRILFHETWIQPITGQAAAVPIVLDSVEGEWPELQGTVTLYQSGDAVLETNLWLNTRGDYLPGTWRMPPPPRSPTTAAPGPFADTDASPLAVNPESGLAVAGLAEYPYRHAVLLHESRRLRAGEVFYIDHPMLGVVAKISSLEAPAPTTPPAASPATPAEVAPSSPPTL